MSRRRRRKRKSTKGEPKPRFQPDLRFVLLVGVPISFLAGILLGYKENTWISLPVCYVWMTGIIFAYCLYLLGVSRYLLPLSAEHKTDNESGSTPTGYPATHEGARLVFFHSVRRLLPPGLRARLGFTFRKPPEGVPESFGVYGAGIVPSNLALALGRGLGFTRAAGPGYVRLDAQEYVMETIDLRLQYREQEAQAVTRDGIPLDTKVSTLFRVRGPAGGATLTTDRHPYPYSPETVFRLLIANSLDGAAEVTWTERLCPLISGALVSEVSQFSVDQLYQPPSGSVRENDMIPIVRIRDELASQFRQALRTTFEFDHDGDNPLQVLSADFSDLEPPEEVRRQRIDSWRAEWKQRQRQHEAEAEREEILTRQTARARAELEMIQDVAEMVRTVHQATGADLSQVILLRLSEALDQMGEGTGEGDQAKETPVAGGQTVSAAGDGERMTITVQELGRQLRRLSAEEEQETP